MDGGRTIDWRAEPPQLLLLIRSMRTI